MPKRARCPYCDRLFNRNVLDSHVQKCKFRSQENHPEKPYRTVVVDGNNVAYHLSQQGKPKAKNLILAYRSLKSTGFRPIFVVSSALLHNIDKPLSLNEFMLNAEVVQAPKGSNDDLRIILLAKELDAQIITNDRFLDWVEKYPWIPSQLRKYRMTPSGLFLI